MSRRDFSVHCNQCQSCYDGRWCTADEMCYPVDERKETRLDLFEGLRECRYEYLDPLDFDMPVHPCPFFTGYVKYHDGNDPKVTYALYVEKPNTHYQEVYL